MKKFFISLFAAGFAIGLCTLLFSLTANAATKATQYSPTDEGIVSGYFPIDSVSNRIVGLAPGTTLAELNTRSLPGDLVASSEVIGTGTMLTSATAGQTLTTVVTGDMNGDGEITITDLLMVKSYILGEELTELATIAGDVNYDGEVSISDFLGLKACLLGISQISSQNSAGLEPLIVLAPNASQKWNTAAGSFSDDGSGIATIRPDGTIQAGSQEGTCFVYAHNADGTVLARTAVTVLKGGLTISLDKTTYAPAPGQSLQASVVLNHPVSTEVYWEIADSTICSISQDGTMTGLVLGSTTLRATLPNGQFATADVKVMPPITDLDFEKHLHKLKPGSTRQLPLLLAPADNGEVIIWKSSDPSIVSVSDTGMVTAVNYGTATVTATGKYTGLVASCTVKVCDVIQVAITFDDGPSKNTPKLLDWLKENEVKATFFMVGNRLSSFKGTVQRIASEGHELGYHSYSHKQQTKLSTEKIISDFEKSNNMLFDLTGRNFTLWRTPGGGYNTRVLNAIELPHIMWTVDTRDWATLNKDSVYKAIINQSDDGEIILLHDLYKTSVDGAIKAMEQMLEGDYEFLTVTELLSRNGTPPSPCKSYKKAPK